MTLKRASMPLIPILIGICIILVIITYSPMRVKIQEYTIRQVSKSLEVDEGSEIRKRLEDSEKNWLKYIIKRDAILNEFGAKYEKDPWDWADGRTFWDFWQPYYNCPHTEERIGRVGDGGKWICGVNLLAKKPTPCIVYSYGISGDYSFDEDMLERTNCTVYMFDPSITEATVKPVLEKFGSRAIFKPIGLWSNNNDKMYRTLRTEMESNGHDFIDVLKVDIEGAEYIAFRQILDDFSSSGLPFGQLQIELHIFDDIYTDDNLWANYLASENNKKGICGGNTVFKDFTQFWKKLEKNGLRAFRNEPNPFIFKGGQRYQYGYDYAFINVNYKNYLTSF